MLRLSDGVAAVAGNRVYIGDRVTDGAGDPGVGGRVQTIIKARFGEATREQGNRVVAAPTPLHSSG